jgi:uncharacterized protein (TIGR02145 family)
MASRFLPILCVLFAWNLAPQSLWAAQDACLFLVSSATPQKEADRIRSFAMALKDHTDLKPKWIVVNDVADLLKPLQLLALNKYAPGDRVFVYFIGPLDFQSSLTDFYFQVGRAKRDSLSYRTICRETAGISCPNQLFAWISTLMVSDTAALAFIPPPLDVADSCRYRNMIWKGFYLGNEWWQNRSFFSTRAELSEFTFKECRNGRFNLEDAIAVLENNGVPIDVMPDSFKKRMLVFFETRHESVAYGIVTDPRDGNSYKTRDFGCLTWMVENMHWAAAKSEVYADNPNNLATYGRLYNWKTATEACQGLGPGWKLPTTQQWLALADMLGTSAAALTRVPNGIRLQAGGWRTSGQFYNYHGVLGSYWSFYQYTGFLVHQPSQRLRLARIELYDFMFSCRCVREIKNGDE